MSNLSEYVKKAADRKSDLTEVMERRKSAKAQELENLEFDALIAEAKKKVLEASPNKVDHSQATHFVTMLFAGRTPAEIKELLQSLTQEEIDKFSYISARMDPNSLSNMRSSLQPQNTSIKDTIEIVKLVTEGRQPQNQSGNDVSGIAKALTEAMRLGADMSKSNQPANSQNDLQYKMMENSLAEAKATREEMANQNRLRYEREIADLKSRPSEIDVLLSYEEKAEKFRKARGGTDSNVINEWALKKLDMEQNKDIADKNLTFEKEKWQYEKENEGKPLEMIKEILQGPVGEVLKSFGSAGADRIRGSKAPNPNSQAQSPQIANVDCPNCKGTFSANNQLPIIQCPLCGVQLQRGNQPAPSQDIPKDQPPSDSTQAQSSPIPAQEKPADQTVEVESPVEQTATKE